MAARAAATAPAAAFAPQPPGLRARSEPALMLAAVAWAAGMGHAVATAGHLREWPLAGVFFAVLALAQFGWGVAVYAAPSRGLLAAGAAGSVAVVLLWLVSRTVGLPFGPEAGTPEEIGVLDLVCTLDEVLLAVCAVAVLREGPGVLPIRRALPLALVVSLSAMMLAGHSH